MSAKWLKDVAKEIKKSFILRSHNHSSTYSFIYKRSDSSAHNIQSYIAMRSTSVGLFFDPPFLLTWQREREPKGSSFFCMSRLRPSVAIYQPIKRGITAAVMAAEKPPPPLPVRFLPCLPERRRRERERKSQEILLLASAYI